VRGGGKVVKNVAGYDVPKLFVGSYGTLGIIVAATLKLRPLPDEERLVAARFDRIKDAAAAARALLTSDLVPNAVMLLDAEASRAIDMTEGAATLVVGFDGLAEQVEWQGKQMQDLTASFGGRATAPLGPEAWSKLPDAARHAAGTPAAVMRFSVLPTLVGETMEHGAGAGRQRGLQTAWAADAGVGGVTAAVFSRDVHQDPASLAALLGEWREMAHTGGGRATLEWAPLAVKELVPVWDDVGAAARIMRAIKLQLDPRQILNPGRFVGGI
jgi:glycolate oxidase FAD binding subunit